MTPKKRRYIQNHFIVRQKMGVVVNTDRILLNTELFPEICRYDKYVITTCTAILHALPPDSER